MHDRCLVAGHGVVRIHRDNKEVIDTLFEECQERAFSGGVAIAHAEFYGQAGGLSEAFC